MRWVLFATLALATSSFGCRPEVRPVVAPSRAQDQEVVAPATEPSATVPPGPVAGPHPDVPAPSEPVEPSDEGPASPTPVARPLDHLDPFYDALDHLRAGRRERPVRILWLGDSHTAADFMTQRVRLRAFEVGGDGGPGFVRLGLGGYRHGVARLEVAGRWRKEPILPAQRTRVLDGVFGYGGIRTLPAGGSLVTVRSREQSDSQEDGSGQLRWTLAYRLGDSGALRVRLDDERHVLDGSQKQGEEGGETESPISHFTLSAPETARLTVAHHAGDPEVFGVFVERVEPGVVLDTVGINGARVATPLAWEPAQYVAEVRARKPDLLVLAFGTNEAFDKTAVWRYREHFERLVGRVREAVPGLPCWIVGPPDAAGRPGPTRQRVLEITELQRDVAKELGCAFTSALEAMGGEGSFVRWRDQRPALARGDGIHLTIAGYRELGDRLAAELLAGHDVVTLDDVDPPGPRETSGGSDRDED